MIQLKKVSKSFTLRDNESVQALTDVDLEVQKGEIFGIVGRSGAGKSTLLRLVNGLETPTRGEVRVDGQLISSLGEKELRAARMKIGMIFQHFNLLWSRTVRENVAFPLEVAGRPKQEVRHKVDALLERVGLANRAEAYPAQLSGGQKQRVGIARALANDPHVLLCDEATSALDPETTSSILGLLKEINRDTGISLLLITHEMSVVKSICHRVAVMDDGRIVESGEVDSVFKQPSHSLIRQFVQQLRVERTGVQDSPSPGKTVIRCDFPRWDQVWKILSPAVSSSRVTLRSLDGEVDESGRISVQISGEPGEVNRLLNQIGEDVELVEGKAHVS
ncbi:methionine ABC transporter ATP-binding protein [Kroppenstedtia sanguinis]|uniref:Methionine ABC transporter ATP-binding protein n=1 Tax=Kroppenstedtia sanguinis TaxID=1380684 RepID=A0ABW4C966_9BACL